MIKYYEDLVQGSIEWQQQRTGILTASEMDRIITAKKLEYSQAKESKSHLYELAAQRISQYVEPTYIGDEMLRGHEEEIYARELYYKKYAPVTECGFITNDKWGFTLGCSPDGLVGDDGVIEIKSRRQKYQVRAIIENEMDADYVLQVQTILLISERKWCDFISYCGGMPMFVKRIYPDPVVQAAITDAACRFHGDLDGILAAYAKNSAGLYPTERRVEQEITASEGE